MPEQQGMPVDDFDFFDAPPEEEQGTGGTQGTESDEVDHEKRGAIVAALEKLDFEPDGYLVDRLYCGIEPVDATSKAGQRMDLWFDKGGLHATPLEPAKDPELVGKFPVKEDAGPGRPANSVQRLVADAEDLDYRIRVLNEQIAALTTEREHAISKLCALVPTMRLLGGMTVPAHGVEPTPMPIPDYSPTIDISKLKFTRKKIREEFLELVDRYGHENVTKVVSDEDEIPDKVPAPMVREWEERLAIQRGEGAADDLSDIPPELPDNADRTYTPEEFAQEMEESSATPVSLSFPTEEAQKLRDELSAKFGDKLYDELFRALPDDRTDVTVDDLTAVEIVLTGQS